MELQRTLRLFSVVCYHIQLCYLEGYRKSLLKRNVINSFEVTSGLSNIVTNCKHEQPQSVMVEKMTSRKDGPQILLLTFQKSECQPAFARICQHLNWFGSLLKFTVSSDKLDCQLSTSVCYVYLLIVIFSLNRRKLKLICVACARIRVRKTCYLRQFQFCH